MNRLSTTNTFYTIPNEIRTVENNNLNGVVLNLFINQEFKWESPQMGGDKELLYVTAIKNLRKKINFLRLNHEFQNGEINPEEFEQELTQHPEKYIIDVAMVRSPIEYQLLGEILAVLDEEITVDEIAELFSLDMTDREKHLLTNTKS